MEFDPILVHEWLVRSAWRHPDKEALVWRQERWSYGKLHASSNRFAEALLEWGVRRGDRVAILAGNRPETVVSLYGTLKAGGVFVILDGNAKARRLQYVLENSGAKVLVAAANQAATVAEVLGGSGRGRMIVWVGRTDMTGPPAGSSWVTWDSMFSGLAGADASTSAAGRPRLPQCIDVDLASLIYTSATTGCPKGVMCTHRSMIAAARSIIQYLGNEPSDIILNALPLSFDYGLYQVLMTVMFGGTVVLEESFVYLHDVLKRIADEKVTGFPVVPTMVALLLRLRDLGGYDLSTLRYLTSTGAALPARHIRSLRRLLPRVKIFSMFGLTECKRVSYLEPGELERKPRSVGKAMPNCEVAIVDEDGYPVKPGKAGELIVRGSNVMQGYWDDPEMTAAIYRPGPYPASRWLHSGDYFQTDEEGFLYFLGRKDNMIKTRGERVSPKEVEDVVCELPGVAEAAAVPVADDVLGEAVKVFVVARGDELRERDVLRHCASRLESFMLPKYVEFVSILPMTAHGKVDKNELGVMAR